MKKTRLQGALTDAQDAASIADRGANVSRLSTPRVQEHATSTLVPTRRKASCPDPIRAGLGRPNGEPPQLQDVYDRVAERNHPTERMTGVAGSLTTAEESYARVALAGVLKELQHHVTAAAVNDPLAGRDIRQLIQQEVPQSYDNPSKRGDTEATQWYAIQKTVGRGTFGRVQLAQHRISGAQVAIKTYHRVKGSTVCAQAAAATARTHGGGNNSNSHPRKMSQESDALEWKRVRQEVRIMSTLQPHSGIIHFIEAFETPTQMQLVMEYAGRGSLCDLLKRCPQQRLAEKKAREIFARVCGGVSSLHQQNVIHRDLKLENVLLDEHHRPKIVDFGFSQFEYATSTNLDPRRGEERPPNSQTAAGIKNFCGTPSYMAPEVVSCKSYDGKMVDVWSLGIILYLLLCGKFPFQGLNLHQLYQNIRIAQLTFPKAISKDAQDLLHRILMVDPNRRLTLTSVQAHPWMTEQCGPVLVASERIFGVVVVRWERGLDMIMDEFAALFGVSLEKQREAIKGKRQNGATALMRLLLLLAEKRLHKLLHSNCNLLPGPVGAVEQSGITAEQWQISPAMDGDDPAGTLSHKQQLEQLIGLVKKSLR